MVERQAQNLAAGRVFARKQEERALAAAALASEAEFRRDDVVFEMRDLRPVAVEVHHVMRELAAIAVADGGEQPASVVAGIKLDLGDAGEIFADDVGIFFCVGAELVKVDLLVEVRVLGRTLVALGIARVVEAGAVGLPRDAASGGGEVHARHHVGKFLAGLDFKHARSGVFGAVF